MTLAKFRTKWYRETHDWATRKYDWNGFLKKLFGEGAKMIVLMRLLEKSRDKATYAFGYEMELLDGIIEINLLSPEKSSIIKQCSSEKVGENGAYKAMGKLLRSSLNNELPDKCEYVS